jgi:hypothetical protein
MPFFPLLFSLIGRQREERGEAKMIHSIREQVSSDFGSMSS